MACRPFRRGHLGTERASFERKPYCSPGEGEFRRAARMLYYAAIMGKTTHEGLTTNSPEVVAGYEPVIGLEVHVQLKTLTKAFCACSTRFGDPPNSNTCPVCLGMPGALPMLNKRAVELGIRAALALHLNVQEFSRFARKKLFLSRPAQGLPDFHVRIAAGHLRLP